MIEQGKDVSVTKELLDEWVTDRNGPVALYVKQRLLPVDALEEDEQGIVFPPTYADIGYNIDTLSDGTKVATIDSVGSQANRMEPLFKEGGPLAALVPQIRIKINMKDAPVSILDLPHRAADATVQSSPGLAELANKAFNALKQGNASELCALAPTSLVFGVWDSRGGGEKRPRLVRSLIRAWDVQVLHAAAQFNSIWKKLDEAQQSDLKKAAEKEKVDLSSKGLADAPATFRKTKMQQYRTDGTPNPDARVLGGVRVKKGIEREVTVNLLALRGLRGGDKNADGTETKHVRSYLLGLTLLAATQEMDLFLREGCLLRYAGTADDVWYALPRRGEPQRINFADAYEILKAYAEEALKYFKDKWPNKFEYEFNIGKAKELLAKKGEQEQTAVEK